MICVVHLHNKSCNLREFPPFALSDNEKIFKMHKAVNSMACPFTGEPAKAIPRDLWFLSDKTIEATVLGRSYRIETYFCCKTTIIQAIEDATGFSCLYEDSARNLMSWISWEKKEKLIRNLPIVHETRRSHNSKIYLKRDVYRMCLPRPSCAFCGKRFQPHDRVEEVYDIDLDGIGVGQTGTVLLHNKECKPRWIEEKHKRREDWWKAKKKFRQASGLRMKVQKALQTHDLEALVSLREEFARLQTSPD